MLSPYHSLVEPIIKRLQTEPDRLAMVLIGDDNTEQSVTVRQLHQYAVVFAEALTAAGVAQDDVVIIALHHSLALVAAFWGAQYIGATASIATYHIPRPEPDILAQQMSDLLTHSAARAVIADKPIAEAIAEVAANHHAMVIDSDDLLAQGVPEDAPLPQNFTADDQIAYLQYTSGTTGAQKGVMLSHHAILSFVASIPLGIFTTRDDVVINWMPLFHDAGLFFGMVAPLIEGYLTVMMSPFKWVRRPRMMFQAVDQYKATIILMPNSGFNHCVNILRDRDIEGLDLSSLRLMGSASEPIIHESMQTFLERFRPYGLREETLWGAYGMAEHTLGITSSPAGVRPPIDWVDGKALLEENYAHPVPPDHPTAKVFVSSGVPITNVELKIVDDDGQERPERAVGEIIVCSDMVFSGYYRQPELTAQTLRDGWLYTGDMGYVVDGHLYVCGRKKNMIIVGGRNIYPEDLEAIANTVEGIYPDRAVAFGVQDSQTGTEKIVMICDLQRNVEEDEKQRIAQELRQKVLHQLGVAIGEVHLMKRGWVVKTVNGKISRKDNRKKYEEMIAAQN
jgi:acyl-CoA synthetase (AMP-forming)/AMP-acid ligase II